MDENYKILLDEAKVKIDKTFILIEASLDGLKEYELDRIYTPKELEPYDALADRFIRCVEMFAKYFKTYDSYKSITKALTYRDLINIMEKIGLVTNTPIWMTMRDVRNRILHDCLPQQTKDMFDDIMGEFYKELCYSKQKIEES